MVQVEAHESPRLLRLVRDLTAGTTTTEAFWQGVAAEGTPLIEPIEGADHSLVTFLYRSTDPEENIRVVGGGTNPFDARSSRMLRLADTDILYRTLPVRNDARFGYFIWKNPPEIFPSLHDRQRFEAIGNDFSLDPLNRHPFPADAPFVATVTMPAAAREEWIEPDPKVPTGTLEQHTFHSDILNRDREVWTYLPPGHDLQGEPAGLLLLFDGRAYRTHVPTPTILENMLAAGRIPPLVAVGDQSTAEDRLNDLVASEEYIRYLTDELLPWVRTHCNATDDPTRTIVGGSSAGGSAAAFAALRRPDVFGNVVAQSGMLFWSPEGDTEPEWLVRQYAETERLPVRFYVEAGQYEHGPIELGLDESISSRQANRHFRDVLRARGYDVTYQEYPGGHDYFWWRGGLADALIALVGTPEQGKGT